MITATHTHTAPMLEGGSAMTSYNLPAKLAPGLEANIDNAATAIGRIDATSGLPMLTSLYTRHPYDPYLRFFVLRAVPTSAWAEFVERIVMQTEQSGAALQILFEKIAREPIDLASLRLAEPIEIAG